MSEHRMQMTEKDGYEVIRVTEVDEHGNQLHWKYELRGPDGQLIDTFDDLGAATRELDRQVEDEPKGPTMRN